MLPVPLKQVAVYYSQLQNANSILDQSHQPYHYLVEGIRVRDQQIAKQKDHIATLEADLR